MWMRHMIVYDNGHICMNLAIEMAPALRCITAWRKYTNWWALMDEIGNWNRR